MSVPSGREAAQLLEHRVYKAEIKRDESVQPAAQSVSRTGTRARAARRRVFQSACQVVTCK